MKKVEPMFDTSYSKAVASMINRRLEEYHKTGRIKKLGRTRIEISPKTLNLLVSQGKTDEEIAEMLHVSLTTVENRRFEYGIYRDKTLKYDRDMYLRMKEKGVSDRMAAYIFGCTPTGLRNWKSREGLRDA